MNQREMETLKELFVAVLQLSSIHKKRKKSNKRLMAKTIALRRKKEGQKTNSPHEPKQKGRELVPLHQQYI
jgi:hypothetical protein